jgi:hypothetical protein
MADEDVIPTEVAQNIDRSLGEDATKKRTTKRQPIYKVVGDSKIPVSKTYGKIWKSRKDMALKATSDSRDGWEEAIAYFENDQTPHRHGQDDGTSGNRLGNQRLNENITETENVVFANVTTMVPALYARNPQVEMTTEEEAQKDFNVVLERLVNEIMNRKTAPGINLKSKAKRCVVAAALCNRAYIEIGWTFKQDSSEEALMEIQRIAEQLEKAKDTKKIEELEGQLEALESQVDVLQEAGPYAKYRRAQDILVDPNSKEPDLSDAKWVMMFDFLPTQFILARYAKKKKGSDDYRSVYAPTHVMKVGQRETDSHEEDNFSLWQDDSDAKAFGYDNQEAFEKAKMTKVCMVWDKVTRRVLMYNDADWTWPIWVWDDPLQLDQFYNLYPLWYFENLDPNKIKGEVTYYLDQQDAINEMVDEERRARLWARRNIFYNMNVAKKEDVEAVLNGPDGTARGLNIPEDMKLQDIIGSVPPPGLQFKELFDKESKYRAIDRISSVGEVLRGTQFKTNTTNDAVNANVQAQNMRVDEKSDQIEDWIGRIGWGIAQLCLMYMTQEQVALLTNQQGAAIWQNFTADDIQKMFSLSVVGGSGKKPTSQAKKEEALELGQVLGQFVNAAPGPVLKIMLEVMQEAFDEVTIKDEDWDEILAAVTQQTQQQAAPPQGAPQGGNGQVPPEVQQPAPEGGELDQILAALPTELKAQVVQAIQQGMNPAEALQAAMQQIQ